MKRLRAIISCILVLSLCSCGKIGKDGRDVEIGEWESDIYTQEDVQSAIKVAENYFKYTFSGCTLTQITYAGDDVIEKHEEWAERNDADEVIVLTSSFDVDESGGDSSLSPNSTYEDWNWILVRTDGDKWVHVDHGY